jgi:hypothetical protein
LLAILARYSVIAIYTCPMEAILKEEERQEEDGHTLTLVVERWYKF